MTQSQHIDRRRKEIAEQLVAMRALRKGSLNKQWFPVMREGKKTKQLRGPYYVWTYKAGKKTVSLRLHGQAQVQQAQRDAANYRRFRQLCKELEELTQELGELERGAAASQEALKKGLKSRPKQTGKSSGS